MGSGSGSCCYSWIGRPPAPPWSGAGGWNVRKTRYNRAFIMVPKADYSWNISSLSFVGECNYINKVTFHLKLIAHEKIPDVLLTVFFFTLTSKLWGLGTIGFITYLTRSGSTCRQLPPCSLPLAVDGWWVRLRWPMGAPAEKENKYNYYYYYWTLSYSHMPLIPPNREWCQRKTKIIDFIILRFKYKFSPSFTNIESDRCRPSN